MRRFKLVSPVVTVIGICSGSLYAQDVVATAAQPAGSANNWNSTTWGTTGKWSDDLAPSAGKTYSTGAFQIRTGETTLAPTFAGDSLRIVSGGSLLLKQNYGATSTANLILNGGSIISGNGTTGTTLQILAGTINVVSNSTISLPVNGTDRRRIALSSTSTLSGSGNLTINGGDSFEDLFEIPAGVTSTFTGNWTITGGRFSVGNDDVINDASTVTVTGANSYLDLRSNQKIGTLAGTGTITTNAAGTRILNVSGAGSSSFSGTITDGAGSIGLTKEGNGSLTLSGANTFSGATTLTSGTLLLNNTTGSATGTSNIVVNGGTLGGTGSITGSVTLNGGTFAPGASIESLALGALTLNAGSTFAYELNTSVLNGDFARVDGNLTIDAAALLTLTDLAAGTVAVGEKLTLINYSGTWNGTSFSGYADGSTFTLGANSWLINYDDITGGSNFSAEAFTPGPSGFVTLTAVSAIPEPGTCVILAAAGLGWLVFRRKNIN